MINETPKRELLAGRFVGLNGTGSFDSADARFASHPLRSG